MDILRADPILARAKPRLVAYGEFDYAVNEHIGGLRIMRDAILVLLAACVVILAYLAMKRRIS